MKFSKKKISEKKECLVAVWLPPALLHALDRAVAARDTDRSKLIREALRKELDPAKGR
jgi:metal-responsive CopG/Arc/MetJ family transcriptional regulator